MESSGKTKWREGVRLAQRLRRLFWNLCATLDPFRRKQGAGGRLVLMHCGLFRLFAVFAPALARGRQTVGQFENSGHCECNKTMRKNCGYAFGRRVSLRRSLRRNATKLNSS
jgi:hypothetical protein